MQMRQVFAAVATGTPRLIGRLTAVLLLLLAVSAVGTAGAGAAAARPAAPASADGTIPDAAMLQPEDGITVAPAAEDVWPFLRPPRPWAGQPRRSDTMRTAQRADIGV